MKKNTVNIIILTLVIINLVLNALIIFSIVPMANKTSSLVTKIAEIIDLEIADPEGETSGLTIDQIDSIYVTTADESTKLTISLPGSDGKNHYAIATVVISLDKTHDDYSKLSASVTTAMSLVLSKIDAVISSYTYDVAMNNKEEMQTRILAELRDLFQSDMIYDVSFSSFTVQ